MFLKVTLALTVMFVVASSVVAWHHRQPDPRSALGVARAFASNAPWTVPDPARAISIVRGFEDEVSVRPQLWPDLPGEFGLSPCGPRLLIVEEQHHVVCIVVSGVAGVVLRVERCSVGTPVNWSVVDVV